MTPTMWDGSTRSLGKKNPLTLVSTVVARKSAVQPGSLRAHSMPTRAMIPVAIPMRLITTCTTVNVASDMPRIMTRLLSKARW